MVRLIAPFAFVAIQQPDTLFVQNESIAVNDMFIDAVTVDLNIAAINIAPHDDLLVTTPCPFVI
eukprot:7492824-Heterocapsa_arctica.AAC.1